ncbi:hypothetical protein MAR_028420 [Mya arenaria]|uniref:Uncharacterized protein n=1 Tax=Mya arenaria TaxID=6604 RepID=A0ABY7DGB0_MYAAR|nr:hypothetical protein MAR_028420 [Mya arenaria]
MRNSGIYLVPILCLWMHSTFCIPVVPKSGETLVEKTYSPHNEDELDIESVQYDISANSGNMLLSNNGAQTFHTLHAAEISRSTKQEQPNQRNIIKIFDTKQNHQNQPIPENNRRESEKILFESNPNLAQPVSNPSNTSAAESSQKNDGTLNNSESSNTPLILRTLHSKNSSIDYTYSKQSGNHEHSQESLPSHAGNNLSDKTQQQTNKQDDVFNHELTVQVADERSRPLQLKVISDLESNGDETTKVNEMLLTVGTGLAALFSVGVIVGLFCCCAKKPPADDSEKLKQDESKSNEGKEVNEDTDSQGRSLQDSQKPSQLFNSSDLPKGEKDLDDEGAMSVKDKVKALNNKLLIQPSPDKHRSQLSIEQQLKRRSQLTPNEADCRSQLNPNEAGNRLSQHSPDDSAKRRSYNEAISPEQVPLLPPVSKQPKITVSEDEVVMDQSKSTAGDNISKSDTQDDISDKIFDNISMHSSVSQPYNPDVVIADTDEEEDFESCNNTTSSGYFTNNRI